VAAREVVAMAAATGEAMAAVEMVAATAVATATPAAVAVQRVEDTEVGWAGSLAVVAAMAGLMAAMGVVACSVP
jgi:hypothetical protein